MFKIIACILLVTGTSGMGYSYYMELRNRLHNLNQMKEIMTMIENEISYGKASLPNLCRTLEHKVKDSYKIFFTYINQQMKKDLGVRFGDIWIQACDKLKELQTIKKEDIMILKDFMGNQNYNNIEMQIKAMEFRRKELEKAIEQLEVTIHNSKKMYLSLGVMSGLLISIILW